MRNRGRVDSAKSAGQETCTLNSLPPHLHRIPLDDPLVFPLLQARLLAYSGSPLSKRWSKWTVPCVTLSAREAHAPGRRVALSALVNAPRPRPTLPPAPQDGPSNKADNPLQTHRRRSSASQAADLARCAVGQEACRYVPSLPSLPYPPSFLVKPG